MKPLLICVLFLIGQSLFAATPNELRFCIPGDPKTFDPLQSSEENTETIRYLTGGVLVRINRVTDKLEPELAESWNYAADARSISFHLRAGLKFSDGAALTAADVARTFNKALDPKQSSPAGDTFRSEGGVPEAKVTSPRDVLITYPKAKAGLDRLFDALAIAPANPGKLPASAGPYFVADYRPGDSIRLQRNPTYWKRDSSGKQLPYIDSIRIDIQTNRDIELARFLRGEIHLTGKLEPENFDRVAKEKPAAARNVGVSLDPEFLWFNETPAPSLPEWKRKWFTSAAFRHAISESIRRDDIARVVFRGHAHPAAGPVSPANKFWFNAALKPLPYDSQAALKTLNGEGFKLSGDVLRDAGGHPVEFSIVTNSGNRAREAMAAIVQDDLRTIGIQVRIVTLDFPSLIERIMKTSQYEAAILGFANVEVDPNEQMNVWLSSGAQHAWWPMEKMPATPWEARIDQLELTQASEASRDLRKKASDEVQRIAVDQEPIIYLVNPDYLTAISPLLKGAQPVASPPQVLWNIEWLRIE
jgi:peptide/nickel transport system substrate-binding protein